MGDAGEGIVWDYLICDVTWQFIPGISHHTNAALLLPHLIQSMAFDFLFFIIFCITAEIPHSPSGTAGIKKSRGRKRKQPCLEARRSSCSLLTPRELHTFIASVDTLHGGQCLFLHQNPL